MKKIIIIVITLILAGTISYQIVDEPLPTGIQGPEAEALTDKMFEALNKQAWDSLKQISWVYTVRGNKFKWDKVSNEVEVEWSDYRAIVDPGSGTGVVYEGDQEVTSPELVKKAISNFYNDSFWLIAPFKARDPGTVRSVVDYEGEPALLVQYTSGGDTPGDSYLWILDESGKPKAWKFWVQILPVGGMHFTWENWQNVNGALISTYHQGLLDITIDELEGF